MQISKLDSVGPVLLQAWYGKHARKLPWRELKDSNPQKPYAIWLSEIMLQQTQVSTVVSYYEKFMNRFPTVHDLAHASSDEVMRMWAGLGYYSRARNLHEGAKVLSAFTEWPKDAQEWMNIPGVGPYTAGAVSSIAFNRRSPLVDGNVVRVFSRLFAISKLDTKKTAIWKKAKIWVENKSIKPRFLNQALMELGAMVCRPKNPKCEECPLVKLCKGKSSPEKYPAPKKKITWKQLSEERFLLFFKSGIENREDWKVALTKNTQKNSWRVGLWDLLVKVPPSIRAVKHAEWIRKYVVTNHRVQRKVWVYEVKKQVSGLHWFQIGKLPGVPAPTAKCISQLRSRI